MPFGRVPACLTGPGSVLISVLGIDWPGSRSSGCAESPRAARANLLPGIMTIILVTEGHLALRDIQETIIGDRHAMPDVIQHLLGSRKRPLGVDHPFGPGVMMTSLRLKTASYCDEVPAAPRARRPRVPGCFEPVPNFRRTQADGQT